VNLVRFGHRVTLLTAVGRDALGQWLLDVTCAEGVDTSAARRCDQQTSVYVTVGPEGGAPWCINDSRVLESLSPADIDAWGPLLAETEVVVADANLTGDAAGALVRHTGPRPRVLLLTSVAKVRRLTDVVAGAALVIGTRHEGATLAGVPVAPDWAVIGRAILDMGVAQVALTDGARGVAVMTATDSAWAPAAAARVVDPTGAGDAAAAAVVHAHIHGLGAGAAAGLAVAAASVVVQSDENTPAGLAALVR
jgi:pseudouridine kinase